MTNSPDHMHCEYHTCTELATTFNTWPDGYAAYLCEEHLNGSIIYLMLERGYHQQPITIRSAAFVEVNIEEPS